jgi:hypothetical protein
MFEKNKELQRAIDKLYTELKDEEYGSKYSWEELRNLAGLRPTIGKNEVYYVTNKVCLMLMAYEQKYLDTVHKYGKRIVNPEEHGILAKKKAKKSVKIYRKAGAIIACTNMDKLTEEQKKQMIDNANKFSTLEMFAQEMLKKKQIGKTSKDNIKTASLFLDAIKMFTDK